MKKSLARQVRSRRVIESAWRAISRNARVSKSDDTRKEVEEFEKNLTTNLRRLIERLQKGRFEFPPARGVKLPKGGRVGFRPLVVAKIESRIVQRAIHDVLVDVPAIAKYVDTPHSFGGVKKRESATTAVPAAIKAVLDAIGNGGKFAIRSDISEFFTRLKKSAAIKVVVDSVPNEDEFCSLFEKAIAVELHNMAALKKDAAKFPLEDIGVAQGNALSPLIGNLALYEFDQELNKCSDVRCIRYIDDFIILGPSKEVAENTFAKAKRMLSELGMTVSDEKTKRGSTFEKFEFLGIELASGLLRPSRQAQGRLLARIKTTLRQSEMAIRSHHRSGQVDKKNALIQTLKRVDGIMQGWGKHYKFCNDGKCFEHLDSQIAAELRRYLSIYGDARRKSDEAGAWRLIGIQAQSQINRDDHFEWPKQA